MSTIINKSDSMKTIQTKLNNGGTIIFNKGTYKITKQLIIPKNTVINLNGSTLQRKASIQSIFLNKVSSTTKGYNGDGNITIINGTLEGMGGYSYDNLITFFHSHDILIMNCTFKDILCHGIEFNSSTNCSVHDCNFLGFNMKDEDSSYNENIQIDHAGFSGFVLSGSSKTSKCYDGTCCSNIEIFHNIFSKSPSRDYPYACIGAHSQLAGNKNKHTNITIYGNEFHCKKNPNIKQACISITNMENVEIHGNLFDCNRIARIYSKNYSYTNSGTKTTAKDGDGICKNIFITGNVFNKDACTGNSDAFQMYNKSGTTTHTNIVKGKKDNSFLPYNEINWKTK